MWSIPSPSVPPSYSPVFFFFFCVNIKGVRERFFFCLFSVFYTGKKVVFTHSFSFSQTLFCSITCTFFDFLFIFFTDGFFLCTGSLLIFFHGRIFFSRRKKKHCLYHLAPSFLSPAHKLLNKISYGIAVSDTSCARHPVLNPRSF